MVGLRKIFLGGCLCILFLSSSFAQWLTQTIPLRPGWNAVYLTVQPEPSACDSVFGGYPVESVWMWNKRFSPAEFSEGPDQILPQNPHWLVWLPGTNPESFLSTVFRLEAGGSYLVKVATNASPFSLSLKGQPKLPQLDWYPHALNLVGFPVNPVSPPTFASFFSHVAGVDTSLGQDNQLFILDALGRGKVIARPDRTNLQAGVAYWIKCKGDMDYIGPLEISPASGGGLDFGLVIQEQDLTIQNISTTATYTVRVQEEASEIPPTGQAELAGSVPLSFLYNDIVNNVLTWSNMPAQGLSHTLGAGERWQIRFGVRRNDMAPFVSSSTNGAAYQSILKITDSGQSLLFRLPVVAEKEGVRRLAFASAGGELGQHHPNEGLWVGRAVVSAVSCPAYTSNALLPVASALPFRLILHVDAYGQVKLLQRVTFAWVGSETNGGFLLYARDSSVPTNTLEVNRLTAVAFPIMDPVVLTNCLTNAVSTGLTNLLCGTVTTKYDDPTNPFLHKYHPLHDNKDWNFQPYATNMETFVVQRDITLDLTGNVITNGASNPYWGIDEIGGLYEETVLGVRQQPIFVRGNFYLQRVSRLNELH
jgi:hypothetical protein